MFKIMNNTDTNNTITSKYISNFSLICKKTDAQGENAYTHICENFYAGQIEDFNTYLSTVGNLTEKMYNLERNSRTATHISNVTKEKLIEACNWFLSHDEYDILRVILPNQNDIHYNDKDCKEIRNIVDSILNVKYTSQEYTNE